MSCDKCKELNVVKEIRLPNDLENVFKAISDNLKNNTIKEIRNIKLKKNMGFLPFSKIDINGPWDDIISYYFECTNCGQIFQVSAETYHGRGGEWKPVKNIT